MLGTHSVLSCHPVHGIGDIPVWVDEARPGEADLVGPAPSLAGEGAMKREGD
jgi:hypothetical protein